VAGCTIISKNYLSFARVWNASFKRYHPGVKTFVLIVDRIEGAFDPSGEDFETIEVESLRIPRFLELAFQYNILELNTAVKPFFLEFLLRERGVKRIAYFDPDTVLYAPIDRAQDALVDQNIVLLPHILSPMPADGKRPDETDFLISGTYNLGFVAVRESPQTFAFLQWWKTRLLEHGFEDPTHGLFTDQKWIDLAPILFDGVQILKDRGYNVAYWNLYERMDLDSSNGHLAFHEGPLVFFHFSGMKLDQPEQVSRYQNRYRLSDLPAVFQHLFREYSGALLSAGLEKTRTARYVFEYFEDGSRIHAFWRRAYREAGESRQRWSNPFRTGPGSFQEWLLEPARTGSQMPRFLESVYRQRADLQTRYPDPDNEDCRSLVGWAISSLNREYGIEEPFLSHLRQVENRLELEQWQSGGKSGSQRRSISGRLAEGALGKERFRALSRFRFQFSRNRAWMRECSRQAKEPETRRGNWMRRAFGRTFFHEMRTLTWLARDASHYLLGTPWDSDPPATRIGRLVLAAMGDKNYRAARRTLWQLREWSRTQPINVARTATTFTSSVNPELPFGVNLIGYLDTESGIGEIGRSMARMLKSAEIPHVLRNIEQPWLRRSDHSFSKFTTQAPYTVNLMVVNADQVPHVTNQLGESAFAGRHNIGYWFWELSDFPTRYEPVFEYFDEIWVASLFCQKAISARSPIPVLYVPPGFEFRDSNENDRAAFGFKPDDFVFAYVFDGASSLKRKNPGAVVSAFRRAFPVAGRERLILKTANAPVSTLDALRRLAGRSRVEVLGDYLDRAALLGLIGGTDCYVSLHRSEGFGLTILEAMAMGKPVIATNYSGNTDFLHPEIGYPVKYQIVHLAADQGPYPRGSVWANPDTDEAANRMLLVRSQPELAKRVGARARLEIRASWNVSSRAKHLLERLNKLRLDRFTRGATGWVA
jgi:glycosyltransferase involved in cell wall biosynthesis